MNNYIAEFVGTLIFLTVILKSNGDKYVIVAGLLAAILFMGNVSGGHFNPAVSLMEAYRGRISNKDAAGYIVAQLAGGLAATHVAAFGV